MRAMLAGCALTLSSLGAAAANAPADTFDHHALGYRVSLAFSADIDSRVLTLPADLKAGDQLLVRPTYLDPKNYLILQKCLQPDCRTAQVVRAWNAAGYMGPYPVLGRLISLDPSAHYLLWVQHVRSAGTGMFHLIDRDSPPLVFVPQGSRQMFWAANLDEARREGPSHIRQTKLTNGSFVATFQDGATVMLQVLRPVN